MRKFNFLLVVLLVAVLSAAALAQSKGIPVDVPGTGVLFFTYRYEGNVPPYDAVNTIWTNLNTVFHSMGGRWPGPLCPHRQRCADQDRCSGQCQLVCEGSFIVEVDAYHAAANKATKAQLAEKWAANLRRGVEAFVKINEPIN